MITVQDLNGLKREARRRVTATFGLTYELALDQVARENGYATWSVLVRSAYSPLNQTPQRLTADEGPGT